MTNLQLLEQADAILSKSFISQEDIREIKRIIRDEITLQYYEASQIDTNYSATETMVTTTKEDEALLAWQDLKNECELNSLENQSNEQ